MPQHKENEQLAIEAAAWLDRLQTGSTELERVSFINWVSKDPNHVRQLLELYAIKIETDQSVHRNIERLRLLLHIPESVGDLAPIRR
jgi:ferric-dicitrate binding protein FerR (iron transport regulator)